LPESVRGRLAICACNRPQSMTCADATSGLARIEAANVKTSTPRHGDADRRHCLSEDRDNSKTVI
jgi:hypothetical protein